MGGIVSNLVKSGVAAPNGSTQFYDNPAQAGQALAASSAKTAQPGTSNLANLRIGDDGSTVGTPTVNAPPVSAQPTMVHPSFAQANSDGFLSPELTTKGKILSLVLSGSTGALVGDAAARQGSPRTGYPGASAGAVAGLQLPFQMKAQQNELANEQLNQQARRQQIAAFPINQQQEHDWRASEIAKNQAVADRKEIFQAKDGSILERQSDGSLRTLHAAVEKPDQADTVQGRQAIISSMKAAATGTPDLDASGNLTGRTLGVPYTLTPAQETQFVLTGKIPESKQANPNPSELLLRAAQGDKTALKALQIQSDMEIRTHQGFPGAGATDGLTTAQQRQLKTDATWNNITRRMNALTVQYSKTAQFDPDGAAALSKQIDDLGNQAEQRKAQIIQGGGLVLKGARKPGALKPLDQETAAQFLRQAGGDKNKARQLATAGGYSF